MAEARPVLEVRDLAIDVGAVRLVDGVSFTLDAREVLCIVGESGSGKSMSVLALMGLLPAGVRLARGEMRFADHDLVRLTRRQMRALSGPGLAMIFQDPMTALNPVIKVGDQIAEMISLHRADLTRAAVRARVLELLAQVNIADPAGRYAAYPHQLSGGMRQRVMIAMAMAHQPAVLIADEPTTALDVTIQAELLALLRAMRARTGSAMILVTHDLGVVAETADRVLVMYAGRAMETASVRDIFLGPRHPYTVGLLASVLEDGDEDRPAYSIPGQPPSPAARPGGCAFHPRCGLSRGRGLCADAQPAPRDIEPGHAVACHFHDEVAGWIDADFPHLRAARLRGTA